ncbi:MAG: fumarylacetoacetate hydrolase family protein, partial [Thermoproteus sp.]|nr:fumarylacetoacetate hydrolase family protein [Thermoproteus sp.]
MRLLTYTKNGVRKVGLFRNGEIIDLPRAYLLAYDAAEAPDFLFDMRRLIALGGPALEVARYLERHAPGEAYVKPSEIVWEPPVPNPEKIFAVAVNYRAHGKEAGVKPPERPYFFPKFPNALVGHERQVVKHRVVEKMDWEVELVV